MSNERRTNEWWARQYARLRDERDELLAAAEAVLEVAWMVDRNDSATLRALDAAVARSKARREVEPAKAEA